MWDVLELSLKFKGLSETFFQITKCLLILSKQKQKKVECYTLVLMISGKSVVADSINNAFQLMQGTIT